MYQSRISIILKNIKDFLEKVKTSASETQKEADYTAERKFVGNIIISVLTESPPKRTPAEKAVLLSIS